MGLWHLKIPVEVLKIGSEACAIDDRIAPLPDEQVIVKKRASAFHGTYLSGFLRAAGVVTVIVTGVPMAGCVGHTSEDAMHACFRSIVSGDCLGAPEAGATGWARLGPNVTISDKRRT